MSAVSGAGGGMKAPEGLVAVLKGILGVLVAFAAWELVRQTGFIDKRDLPAVIDVLGAAFNGLTEGDMSLALLETLRSWISGLALATVIGIAAGIALAMLPGLELATRPILEFLRPIPSVALIPVALLVLGIGTSMQLFMIVFAAVWPVLFSTKAGVESIDPRYLETGRVLGFGRAELLMRILLPASLPYIATGIRTAAAIALVLAITVEMLTGRPGIGFYIENVRLNGLTAEMWGGILVTGIFGYLVNALFIALERLLLPWSPENRDG
ncbi:MAG: ABC transporter permease [Rhizobiales bacterium]|nr:ABC transporter permease [Hyphomicrobiales bacterium]MBA68486.1 ABC transporter permease [Hyphomicrobiales bacterium]